VEWNRIATLNITPVKPIDRFSSRWTNIVQKISSTSSPSTLRVVIVGGGAGGCELALAIHSRLTKEFQSHGLPISSFRVILVHKGSEIMPIHNPGVRRIVSRLLIEKGIALHLNANVVNVTRAVDSTQLLCEDGQVIESDEVIWCTQVSSHCFSFVFSFSSRTLGGSSRMAQTNVS
jgi:selenide, water dikinase